MYFVLIARNNPAQGQIASKKDSRVSNLSELQSRLLDSFGASVPAGSWSSENVMLDAKHSRAVILSAVIAASGVSAPFDENSALSSRRLLPFVGCAPLLVVR